MAAANPLLDSLDRAGYRLTMPRQAIAGLIAEQPGHFTADELLLSSRRRHLGLGRATVFRSLDLFAELGSIERLDLPDGTHAFVACKRDHHHHVVCARCGATTDVDDPGLADLIERVASTTGYRIDAHRLELFGTCPRCLTPAAAGGGR